MDNLEISMNNYFVSKDLDRLSNNRTDDTWLNDKLSNSDTLIIPLYGLKLLFSGSDQLFAVFLKPDFFNDLESIKEYFIFLGESNGKYYFCIEIEKIGLPQESYLKLGEFRELRFAAPLIEKETAGILAYARAIIYWHQHHVFCGVCGHPTQIKFAGHKRICSNSKCGEEHFPRTDPAIIVLVSNGDKCLLARQPKWRPGQYATIAGFVEPGESLEQAVAREVYEETGIELKNIWYRSSQPWPFPAAIMLGFRANAKTTKITLHDNELEDAQWLTRKEIKLRLLNNIMKLPFSISISFRLVEEWFNEGDEGNLFELISSIDPTKR
jgi:NAD+ diphosphatase